MPWPRVIDGETVWACCVSSIGPACRHQWVPCIACGDYFDPTVTELSTCEACRGALTVRPLPLHRTEAGYPNCATCDGAGCYDCTDPA